jgi:hypothetical protein
MSNPPHESRLGLGLLTSDACRKRLRVALKRPPDSGIFEGVSRGAFKAHGTFVPRTTDFVGTVSDVTYLIGAESASESVRRLWWRAGNTH